jgi:D-Tyr-tRNAtyr deacylase
MRVLIQRVKDTRLYVKNKLFSEIDDGFLIFLGIENEMRRKLIKL